MRLGLPIMRKPSRPFAVLSDQDDPGDNENKDVDDSSSIASTRARRSRKKQPQAPAISIICTTTSTDTSSTSNSTTSTTTNNTSNSGTDLRKQIVNRHHNNLGTTTTTSSNRNREEMVFCVENLGGTITSPTTSSNKTAQVMERVEVILSYDTKGQRVMKILCIHKGRPVPHGRPELERTSSLDDFVLPDLEEYAEKTTTFLEDFACSVLDPCQCESLMKPALRKEKRADRSGMRNSVSFDTVDIKEFPMTLGDHPSAASGPPIALNWDVVERERSFKLDEYEASRSPRRTRRQLKLSLRDRKGILQKQFTAEEVLMAWSEAKAIREQRKETVQRGLFMMLVDDVVETANRRAKRISDTFSSIIL
jgi:hypothetical protein